MSFVPPRTRTPTGSVRWWRRPRQPGWRRRPVGRHPVRSAAPAGARRPGRQRRRAGLPGVDRHRRVPGGRRHVDEPALRRGDRAEFGGRVHRHQGAGGVDAPVPAPALARSRHRPPPAPRLPDLRDGGHARRMPSRPTTISTASTRRTPARPCASGSTSPANPTATSSTSAPPRPGGAPMACPSLSDECYIEFTWSGPGRTILEHGADGVLAVHSLSKRSNLAGARAGCFAGDGELVRAARCASTPT